MHEIYLRHQKILVNKLEKFGFVNNCYEEKIFDELFLTLIFENDKIFSKIVDKNSGYEYTLHLTDAVGNFVGKVRQEYDRILNNFIENCCEKIIFNGEITKKLIEYVEKTYGDKLEFLWTKFPENAIFRRKDSKKWYAAIMIVSEEKLKLNSDKTVEILDLRGEPEEISKIIDGKKYFNAWHMNKKNWLTLRLDGSVSFDEICDRLNKSYLLAVK